MQTILGAGGPAAHAVAQALPVYTDQIRLVSRNPRKVNPTDELAAADLTNLEATKSVLGGTEVAYLLVGFPYSYRQWALYWPPVMDNAIEACAAEGCKLVFLDNVYMYADDCIPHMTENCRVAPSSKKGQVRALVLNRLLDTMRTGRVEAIIARSADFYGPEAVTNSVLVDTVIKPLLAAKTANWIGNPNCLHSFTYTEDLGKAVALLGNTPDAYGEQWHLPTTSPPLTGRQYIELIAKTAGVKPRFRTIKKGMLNALGLFTPVMREVADMYHQNRQDYFFDSGKYEARFDLVPTPYEEGIARTVEVLQKVEAGIDRI